METRMSGFVTDVKPDTTLKATTPLLLRRALALVLTSLAFTFTLSAQEPKRAFDVPAGEAEQTLKQFATQAQREIVFSPDNVAGLKTNPVQGEFAPGAALDLMLADTGLTATQDAKTGAFAVRKSALPNGPRAAPVTKSDRPERNSRGLVGEENVLSLERYEVLGSRIRQTEAVGSTPVNRYDSEDIRSSGALTLSDFLRSLPQAYSGVATGRSSAPSDLSMLGGSRVEGQLPFGQFVGASPDLSTNVPVQTGVSGVSLRNLGSGSTLILVDGRRVTQSGVGNRSSATRQGFVDLNTIPLGLIESIEIITDGASAIYGADAVAGVINIILRKNWSGSELSASSRIAEHGGGTEWQTTLTTGFSTGRLRGTLALDFYRRDPIYASQRSFSKSMDYRGIYLGETTFGPAFGGDYRMQFGYAPTVQVVPFNSTGFAGVPGVRVALAPEGATTMPPLSAFMPRTTNAPNQSSSLTAVIGQGQRAASVSDFLNLVPKAERKGITGNFNYDTSRDVEFYGSLSHSDSRSLAETLPAYIATPGSDFGAAYIVPAAYNPFGEDVAIGMILRGFGALSQRTNTVSDSLTLGVRGKIGQTWNWDAGYRWQEQDFAQVNRNFNSNATAVNAVLRNTDTNFRFNPFIVDPQASKLEVLALYPTVDANTSLKSVDAAANGALFDIWGGSVRAALGGSIESLNNFSRTVTYTVAATPVATVRTLQKDRRTHAAFGELQVPLFGKNNRLPAVERLEVSFAGRHENFDDMASAFVPKVGLVWSPVTSLLFRAGRSEGYRAPSISEDLIAATSGTGAALDPQRGNSVSFFTLVTRPNPELKAEESTNDYAGMVFEPDYVKGLSLQVNFYQTVQKNAIQYLNAGTLIRYDSLFPGLVTRGAPSSTDLANGWPGAVTRVINQAINFGKVENQSIDYQIDYQMPWDQFGQWRVAVNAARTLKATRELAPGSPPIDDEGDSFGGPKWSARGTIQWRQQSWSAMALVSYISGFATDKAGLTTFPNAPVPAMYKIDGRIGYEFERGLWRGHGKGLRLNIGISNIADKKPPFTNTIYGFNAGLHGQYVFGRTYEFSFVLPLK